MVLLVVCIVLPLEKVGKAAGKERKKQNAGCIQAIFRSSCRKKHSISISKSQLLKLFSSNSLECFDNFLYIWVAELNSVKK